MTNQTLQDLANEYMTYFAPVHDTKALKKEYEKAVDDYLALSDLILGKVRDIPDADVYTIVGYGSLLNERSRARTLVPITVEYGVIEGWRRIFNLGITQGTCLNVEPDENSSIDAAIITVDRAGMFDFILREINYDLVAVTTTDGTNAYMVVATIESGQPVIPVTEGFTQLTQPRLDYINACIYGINELKADNLFLTDSTVLYNGQPLIDHLDIISGTTEEYDNLLVEYFKEFDSAY